MSKSAKVTLAPVPIQEQTHVMPHDPTDLGPTEYAESPAAAEHRPHSDHRYPAPRPHRSRRSEAHWTIGDALKFLDPQPPRRTLSRWLNTLEQAGTRPLPQGGPPAATYPAAEIMQRHAKWVKRHVR